MLKSLVRAEYNPDNTATAANFTVNTTDLVAHASVSEATIDAGSTVSNLVLTLEKPASFSIEYNIPNQDLKFQFINTGNLLDKEVTTTYTHWIKEKKTALDGILSIDSKNKLCANYEIGTKNCKFKYNYRKEDGATTFEPCYDLANNCWNFSFWQRFSEDTLLKASFQTSTNVLELELSQTSTTRNGSLKVSASLNLVEKFKVPKICAESVWNFDL